MGNMNKFTAKIVDYKNHHFQIRQIRNEVFIGEQKVPKELEIDGLDDNAIHVLVYMDKKTIGTGRMLPDGHIGRIAVRKAYRGKGIGKIITKKLIDAAKDLNLPEVWLSSQCHAKTFYQKSGFVEVGDVYKEAGSDHIKMKKKLQSEEQNGLNIRS